MRRPFFFLAAATVPLLLYARTASFDFVRADDSDLIAANQPFLSDVRNVPRAFARSYFDIEGDLTAQKTYYRPVTIASFMVDAVRGGADPRPYHQTNVVLHAAAVCLLLALALSWGATSARALSAALVFAVHPVNVQAVAWIAGRNDLLAAVFGLVSLLSFSALSGVVQPLRAAARGAQTCRAAGHVITFALALFSKEIAIAFPALAVVHQLAVRRERLTRAQRVALACDAGVVVLWAALRARALSGMPSELSSGSLHAAWNNLPHVLLHAGKMLLPLRLNVSPGIDPLALLTGLAALLAFAWAAWRWMPSRSVLLAVCWVLAFLLPTLVVPGLPAYEHRTYLPLLGILAILAAGKEPYGVRAPRPDRDGRSMMGRQRAAVALVVVLFALLAYRRQSVFRDPFTYWTDGTRDARFGPIAHVNLGQLHESAGRPLEARREYLRALQRDPNTPKAHNNLGVVLMAIGEPDLAIGHFRDESRNHPWNADAWFNQGLWSEMHGDMTAARRFYERALIENPRYLPARQKLEAIAPAAREP